MQSLRDGRRPDGLIWKAWALLLVQEIKPTVWIDRTRGDRLARLPHQSSITALAIGQEPVDTGSQLGHRATKLRHDLHQDATQLSRAASQSEPEGTSKFICKAYVFHDETSNAACLIVVALHHGRLFHYAMEIFQCNNGPVNHIAQDEAVPGAGWRWRFSWYQTLFHFICQVF